MPILWMMLPDSSKLLLIELQFERYGAKLQYPGDGKDISVEPAIENPEEIEKLMRQTKRSF